jgi:DNA-binding MarR family transcriptional regulator
MSTTKNLQEKLIGQMFKSLKLLHQAHSIDHQTTHEQAEEKGFNFRGQGRLINFLYQNDGIPLKDIVLELDIRPSSASELVAKLEKRGLATRTINDGDKRVVNVFLTQTGKELAQKIAERHDSHMQEYFVGLSTAEQEQLSELLSKMNASLTTYVAANGGEEDKDCERLHAHGLAHGHGHDHFSGARPCGHHRQWESPSQD